ncbi:serine/threonine-protein kinase pakC-like [Schistocerca gregaria]|uniref:serine/threonine-protein kinase pakC-like n=1 Tax=Schistocerca gregaria TaxID=7010 RepID=UPI00211EDF7E|nr:serine/threonine-protein kinase pakC-like [Schistocerca gregaria]XP_049850367.1 serine/threonine-protein kinase pakC-like [Schistocerca gregaria]
MEKPSKNLASSKSVTAVINELFALYGRELKRLGLKRSDMNTRRDCVLLFNILSWMQGFKTTDCQKYISDYIDLPNRSRSNSRRSENINLSTLSKHESSSFDRSRLQPQSSWFKSSWIPEAIRQVFGEREDELDFDTGMPPPIEVVVPKPRRSVKREVELINPHDYFVNQKFDRIYKRGAMLGKGHYGSVYVAKSRADSLTYAAKEIWIHNTRSLMLAKRELLELKSSNHPNIVKFIEGYIFGQKVWIVMEYCQRGNVTNLVRSLELEEPHIAFLLHEILCGLEYLHSKNVVHSDLKGANILLSTNGGVKIADLGLSSIMGLEEREIGGSCYWVAPETMLAWRCDTKSDIYSLGCVCIEMVTGHPPCSTFPPLKALYYKSKYGFPMIDDKWSISLKDFVRRCMDPDPDRRPDAKSLLQHPLLVKRCNVEEHMRLVDKAYYIKEMTSDFD